MSIACERLEGDAAAGEAFDLDVYGQLTDRLGRCLQRLGLKRVPRDVTSFDERVAQLMAERRANPPPDEDEPFIEAEANEPTNEAETAAQPEAEVTQAAPTDVSLVKDSRE